MPKISLPTVKALSLAALVAGMLRRSLAIKQQIKR
jgi:hypothetical protein